MFTSTIGDLKYRGNAFTLPGVGIFVNPKDVNNIGLLRHEFGHILQARKNGYVSFYVAVSSASIASGHQNGKDGWDHRNSWTETSANRMAYEYFGKPKNWDFVTYPLYVPSIIKK